MENTRNKIFFWIFVLVWGALVVWNTLTPPREFSESENRYLKSFPVYTNRRLVEGDFMEDMNTYLNDQFAGRPVWVMAQSLLEYAVGKREMNGVYLSRTALLGDVMAPDEQITNQNIDGINRFSQTFGKPVYTMLVPSSTSVQPENLPLFAAGWDENAYIIAAEVVLSSNVTPVNITETLQSHRSEYIYYRTDHHWTSYGAFLAYRELATAMGLKPKEQADFSITSLSENFMGTFHSKTGFPLVKSDLMELYEFGRVTHYGIFDGIESTERGSAYYDEYLGKKDKYSYFFGQVQPIVTIQTDSPTNRKLLVFKDSYAHCLMPMLFGEFSEIRMIDLRFLAQHQLELMEIENYDDALFLYSTDVFSHQPGASKLTQMN